MTPFIQSLIFRCIGYNLYHVLEIWIYCESSVKLKMNCEDKILCSPCQFLIIYYVISFITNLYLVNQNGKNQQSLKSHEINSNDMYE